MVNKIKGVFKNLCLSIKHHMGWHKISKVTKIGPKFDCAKGKFEETEHRECSCGRSSPSYPVGSGEYIAPIRTWKVVGA